MKLIERYRGALLGLACGDAVGTALEFRKPGTFEPIDDMIGGGPFELQPGQWTDDTSMMLCLAESLIENNKFDAKDQMGRYYRWYDEGYLSSTGTCFDIGGTTQRALIAFKQSGNPYSGLTTDQSAGNGSIMRLAPVPLFFAMYPPKAEDFAAESSKTTHAHPLAVEACKYMAWILVDTIYGATKEQVLTAPTHMDLVSEIAEVAAGSFKAKQPPEIVGSGFVVKSLEAALWAFYTTDNFRDGCLRAVNLGNDADTTAAVYGQIAGTFYGEAGIPQEWREKLAMKQKITDYADRIFELSGMR
jgi:ADP-ribosyl-[dinitrogen reductase] hydrolase